MALRADRLKQRRQALHLSQEQLAERTGVNQPQVSRWELGENDVSGETLAALARALSTTSDWLLGLSNDPQSAIRYVGDLNETELEVISALRTTSDSRRQVIAMLVKAIATLD